MNSIAQQIINARQARGLAIEELANKLGVSIEHIINIEEEKAQPDLMLLETIAKELNYSFYFGNVSI